MIDEPATRQPRPEPGSSGSEQVTRFSRLLAKLNRAKGIVVAAAGVGAVLSGLVGYWTTYKTIAVGTPQYSASATPASIGALSIVVLPFANQTGDLQKAYIADALTTSVTSDLSRIRDAFVISPATAFTYKDKVISVQQVGRDVGVRFVLHGSVLSSGEKIRISAQLADTLSGAQLWSETFDGELVNLFGLQDQVTNRIGTSIGREMVIVAARESETRKSSPKVVDLMLRASALRLKPQSLKTWQQIEELYRQVLTLEPGHANAIGSLANVVTIQAANFSSAMDEAVRDRKYAEGRALALKAKEIDPDNPGIYVALGLYASAHDDFSGWRRAAETRLSLDPKNPSALNNLALSHLDAGEPQRAIELLQQAISLDPRHPIDMVLVNLGWAYFMLGNNEAAVEWCLKAIAKAPAFPVPYAYLALAYAIDGDDARSRGALAELRQIAPTFSATDLAKPQSSSPQAYRDYWEKQLLPAAQKAGLAQ